MIITCTRCERQISFAGRARDVMARLFGWVVKGGRYYCHSCGERE